MYFFVLLIAVSGPCVYSSPRPDACRLIKKFDGFVASSDFIDKFSVRSGLECANRCVLSDKCKSLFYIKDVRVCQTHSKTYRNGTQKLTAKPSATYYEKEGQDGGSSTSLTTTILSPTNTRITTASTATTTTKKPDQLPMLTPTRKPTTPPEDVCPPAGETIHDVNVTLADNSKLSLRIFLNVPVSQLKASSTCSRISYTLYEVVTKTKFKYTKELLSCPAYTDKNFWTNGRLFGSGAGWQTLSGNDVPMTSSFWHPGRPDGDGKEECVRLEAKWHHHFDDCSCDDPAYTICERDMK